MSSAICFNLDQSRILSSGNGLIQLVHVFFSQVLHIPGFDEIGSKFSKWVENTVEKGEIARYEQFLLFPQCF